MQNKNPDTAPLKRIEVLDCFRGIAAMAVLLFHLTNHGFKYGEYGVQFFFIISGFVIFKTVESVKTTREFIIRRFFRLYPTYWVCLLITTGIVIAFAINKPVTARQFLVNLTMIQDLLGVEHIDWSYWSLIPELFFYTYMVFLIWFKLTKYIFILCIAWLCVVLVNYFYNIEESFSLIRFLNVRHGQLFVAGIMFYRIYYDKGSKLLNYLVVLLTYATALMVYSKRVDLWEIAGVISVIYILFLFFVFGWLEFLKIKIFLFLGALSYPLYLIHQRISYVIREHYDYSNNYLFIGGLMIILIGLAYLIHKLVEIPAQRRARKILSKS